MKNTIKTTGKFLLASLLLSGGVAIAADDYNTDEKAANLTLKERLYLFDGYGSKWGLDAGNDGLWFVPEQPIGDTYTAPFKIRNTAADNTLVIGGNDEGAEGYVGIGTDTPSAKLDVNGSIKGSFTGTNTVGDGLSNLATLSANNSASGKVSDAGFRLENAKVGFQWDFRTLETAEGFAATKFGTGGPEFRVDNPTSDYHNAKVTIGGVVIFENGALVTTPSSSALKTNIKDLETKAAMKAFHQLKPVTFAYKTRLHEPVVGFIAEDVPELVAVEGRKSIHAAEILAVLTKVVQKQDKKITELEADQAEIKVLKKRLSTLESLLTNLALNTDKRGKEKLSIK